MEQRLGAMLAAATAILGNRADAVDAVQDASLRAARSLGGFQGRTSVCTWFHRILLNRCYDLLAERGRRVQLISEAEVVERWRNEAYTVDADKVLETMEQREMLSRALARLSLAHRTALLMHDVQGWKLTEIAEMLDLPLPTVKSHLRRARQAMVTLLASAPEDST
ncbi:MAG: RNA polymerase sigma factor [Candidatus Dormibacteraceae bacterium]